MYVFRFETEDGQTATATFTPKTEINETTHYAYFTGYDVEVKDGSGQSMTVTGTNITIVDGVQTVTITVEGVSYTFRFNPPTT